MKHVFLYAYDKVNLGDDLFVRTITNRYPQTKFYMWSDLDNRHNFSDISNLTVIDCHSKVIRGIARIWKSFPARYRAWIEKHCDIMVYIGGSIFAEYSQWERYVEWWRKKAVQKPMYILGANWGPYFTPQYQEGMKEVFGLMKDVCFRDQYSIEQFQHISSVRYAPDILFACPIQQKEIKEKQIFVSVIDCGSDDHILLNEYKEKYIENMSLLLKQYLENGCTLILSSFCKKERDDKAISDIMNNICTHDYADNIKVLSYNGTNGKKIIEAISSSNYVIATRFHGIVLALAAGRPVLPIVYSDKTLHMLESICFDGCLFDLRLDEPFSFDLSKEHWKNYKSLQLKRICDEAEKHFSKLDRILK